MDEKNMLKILVCGDVDGQFIPLYNKVKNINKKNGPFNLLLCCGNFFNPVYSDEKDPNHEWQSFKCGSYSASLPTLILGPTKSTLLPYFQCSGSSGGTGCELCENITYLGDSGVYKMASGVTIAYLSGVAASDGGMLAAASEAARSAYNMTDINNIVHQAKQTSPSGVDILLTSEWPYGVHHYATSKENITMHSENGSSLISHLCQQIKPRYHFVGLNNDHYERCTYRNHEVLKGQAQHVTRFIALAKFANSNKKKFLYAFSLEPMSSMSSSILCQQPDDVTECPYNHPSVKEKVKQQTTSAGNDKRRESSEQGQMQFFYDMSGGDRRMRGRGGYNKRPSHSEQRHPSKLQRREENKDSCWFCLGASKVEKHLVVSVGDEVYLALAKGGLTPEHALILPVTHLQSMLEMPETMLKELSKYKKKIRKLYKSIGKVPIYWERNYKTHHSQIQVVPIDKDISKEVVKSVFLEHAVQYNVILEEVPSHADLHQFVRAGIPYFYVELPGKVRLFSKIQKGQDFPLQFGREIVCDSRILNIDSDKIEWRNCDTDIKMETERTQKFRKLFQPYEED